MNRQCLSVAGSLMLALSSCVQKQHSIPASSATGAMHLEVRPAGSRRSTPDQPRTSPDASRSRLSSRPPTTRELGSVVSFDQALASAWHSHPAGQTLIVTAGNGWVQEWGGEKLEIKPGDVCLDAARREALARATEHARHDPYRDPGPVGGKVVDWMEQVTGQQYGN